MEGQLERLREYAAAHKVPIMHEDGARLLVEAVKAHNPSRILEIGTAIGYSGTLMLSVSGARLYTIEIDDDAADIAEENFKSAGLLSRVTLWRGDACEILRYAEGEYDFVLLDGPKGHYAELLPYIVKLLKKGGVIFADNVLFKGYTFMENPIHKHRTIINSLKAYLAAVSDETLFDTRLYEVGDGIAVSIKK